MEFVLRPEHEEAFDRAAYDRFKKKTIRSFRRQHPDACARYESDAALRSYVDRWCETARKYGLKTEKQMIRFLRSCLLLSDDLSTGTRHVEIMKAFRNRWKNADAKSLEGLRMAMQFVPQIER